MKKLFFCLILPAILLATTATAQISVAILSPDTNLITVDSIPSNGIRLSGTGVFHVRGNYRVQGTTVWYQTDTTTFTAGITSFSKGFGGLQALTTYEFSYTAFNAGGDSSMTTPIKVATTKPLPQTPTVFVLDTIPGLPKSGVSFAASSVEIGRAHV